MQKLNLPSFERKIMQKDEKPFILDIIRRQYVALTPEEWVRRHVIEYLINWCGVELQRVITEYPVMLNGQSQRADIVVVGCDAKPLLLVECKATDVDIDQGVLDQAVRYNSVVGARFLMLTNGLKTFCLESLGEGRYTKLTSLPKL